MRLHPEHVALAIADRRDVVRRAARIPRVAGVSPSIVDEAEHDLIVVDEFLQHFLDRKSTRLNSSHTVISYAVFCLKKKNKWRHTPQPPSPLYTSFHRTCASRNEG